MLQGIVHLNMVKWRGNPGGPDLINYISPLKVKSFLQLGTEEKLIDLKQEKDSACHYRLEDGESHVAKHVGSF